MRTILGRLMITISLDRFLPDDIKLAAEDFLQRIDPYQYVDPSGICSCAAAAASPIKVLKLMLHNRWQYHETDRREVAKCKAWLEIHLASWNDLFILPVTSQSFLKARWEDIDVSLRPPCQHPMLS